MTAWSRVAMLLASPALAVAAFDAIDLPGEVRPFDALACYVALANDLTPLIDADAPDVVAASPQCAGPNDRRLAERRC